MAIDRKTIFLFIALAGSVLCGQAQNVYTITADSTKLSGCDSNELIIENHTRAVNGFLYNTGNGRTVFKKGLIKVSDSMYVIGGDTLRLNPWVQGGNKFGTTGILGTLDNNSLDLYTNNTQRMRFTNTGRFLMGTATDNNRETLQLNGSMYMNSYLSNFLAPSGTTSGALRLRWGTGDGSYISFYRQANTIRRGYIASPSDNGSLVIEDSVGITFKNTPIVAVGTETAFSNAKLSVTRPLNSTLDIFNAGRYKPDTTAAIEFAVKGNGNVIVGPGADLGYKFQIAGDSGYVVVNPNLSVKADRVRIGGALNRGDGQESLLSASNDGGVSFYNAVVYRNGSLGLGTLPYSSAFGVGNPAIGIRSNGNILFKSSALFLGNDGGPTNSSALTFFVSNVNEYTQGAGYPNGQNYYYMGTILSGPSAGYKRAPLRIAADQLQFMTGGNTDVQAAVLSESGNLGIGTSSPSAQLHTTGTVRFAGLTNVDTLSRVLVSDVNGNLYYRNASSLAMGDIPGSSLAVNGPVRARSLTLSQTGWPDYVFDSAYRLMPLKEVEGYIRAHNHLPDVPSAASVEKDGLSVGETQAALLKKIEELTLYNIAGEKKIEELKQMVEMQSRAMGLMQKRMDKLEKKNHTHDR